MTLEELTEAVTDYLLENVTTGSFRAKGFLTNIFPGLEVVPTETLTGGFAPALDISSQTAYRLEIRGVWTYTDNNARLFHSDPTREGSLLRAVRSLTNNPLAGVTTIEWNGEWTWEEGSMSIDELDTIMIIGSTNLLFQVSS